MILDFWTTGFLHELVNDEKVILISLLFDNTRNNGKEIYNHKDQVQLSLVITVPKFWTRISVLF